MLSHQLKMSSSKAFKTQFPEWENISEHLLMQGRLYTNPFDDEAIPKSCLEYQIEQSRIKGYWCYDSQKHLITDKLYVLDKKDWVTGRNKDSVLFSGKLTSLSTANQRVGNIGLLLITNGIIDLGLLLQA